MSYVHFLAADRPLPLCDFRTQRVVTMPDLQISGHFGFSLAPFFFSPYELRHCRSKSCCYDMPDLVPDEHSLADLKRFLSENLSPGESVELWHACLDLEERPAPPRYRGTLDVLDAESFSLLFENECCLTVTV